jgi:hypothetical protein
VEGGRNEGDVYVMASLAKSGRSNRLRVNKHVRVRSLSVKRLKQLGIYNLANCEAGLASFNKSQKIDKS